MAAHWAPVPCPCVSIVGPRPGFPRYFSRGCWVCLVFPGFVVVSHVAVLVFSSCSTSVASKDVLQRFFTFQQPGSWREIKTPRFPREESLQVHIRFVWEMTCGCFLYFCTMRCSTVDSCTSVSPGGFKQRVSCSVSLCHLRSTGILDFSARCWNE